MSEQEPELEDLEKKLLEKIPKGESEMVRTFLERLIIKSDS